MGLIFVPLLPFILSNVHSDNACSASGMANAVQQVGGALGIAVVGEVFFSHLGGFGGSGGYGHAFASTAVLQMVLLGVSAVVAMFLPRRIAPSAYQR
jgi:hypothetical protein